MIRQAHESWAHGSQGIFRADSYAVEILITTVGIGCDSDRLERISGSAAGSADHRAIVDHGSAAENVRSYPAISGK